MLAWNLLHHRQLGLGFGTAVGLGHATVNRDAVAVLHQHVPGVAQLGFLARTLARQPRFGVGGRLMRGIAAPLAMEVTVGLPGSSGGCWSDPSLGLKLLWLAHASIKVPSTVKCSVESRSRPRACSSTSANRVLAISPPTIARDSW